MGIIKSVLSIILILILCIFSANSHAKKYKGVASYYHYSLEGSITSSGEKYKSNKYTLASRTIPNGTIVSIKNLKNNKKVIAKVNDYGPIPKSRIIDVSWRIAKELLFIKEGLANVEIQELKSKSNSK